MRFILLFFLAVQISACSHNIYIVRHGEKALPDGTTAMMKNDPTLSPDGQARAEALKEVLKKEKIRYIYSTNTIRTRSTAEPTRQHFGIDSIMLYAPVPTDAFIQQLKTLKKNALVVGHSNTIDDLVNRLCGETKVAGDLPETIYDNLYIIRVNGKQTSFENRKYGRPSSE
jgi:broad specificity phosphatase PhoE